MKNMNNSQRSYAVSEMLISQVLIIFQYQQQFNIYCSILQTYYLQTRPFDKQQQHSNYIKLTLMSIFDKLVSKNLFWTLQSAKLPPNIRDFSCEFVIDEFQSDGPSANERIYLRFTHPQQKPFQIMIDEFYPPNSAIYDAQINISKDLQEPVTTLNSQFEAICFTSIRNYQPIQPRIMEVEFNENSAYSSDDQICHSMDLVSEQYYSDEDDYSVADYSSENEAQVKHKVLLYFKNPDNKMKKIKDLKAYLKGQKINVPDSHLKSIVTTYCGTHIWDKKKGYQVLPEYLSFEEKKERRQKQEKQEQEREKEMKKNQKKKTTKKEPRTDRQGRTTVQISTSQVEEQRNSLLTNDFKTSVNNNEPKPSTNKKDSKKNDASPPKPNKKPKGK